VPVIFVKGILAGLVAVLGAIILLLLFDLLFGYVTVPSLINVGGRVGTGSWMMGINVCHASAVAAIVFLLGFGWEYRRVKARQAN
jgi:hypothetical protein